MNNEYFPREILNPQPITTVIYDFDGLLFDTEVLWFGSYQEVCLMYGIELVDEMHSELVGRSGITKFLIEKYKISEEIPIFGGKVSEVFQRRSSEGVTPMPGAFDLISSFEPFFDQAIGSSSNTLWLEEMTKKHGIRDFFKTIIGGDQVRRRKPAPDTYLEVAQRLHVDPQQCVVFEDSIRGIQAAKAAGMRCVAIPNPVLAGEDFSIADEQLSSLLEVNLDTLSQLKYRVG